MGYHIKYEELSRVRESILSQLDAWLEQLDTLKGSLRLAADMPEMKGATGDSVRNYLKEVHLSLVEMIQHTIQVYRDNLVLYTSWYYSIETDMMAEFCQESIENQMELLNSGRFSYDETMETLSSVLSEVSNYMSIEPVSRLPVTSKYATTYIHLDNLNNALGQYEEAHKNTDLTLTEEMIRNITAIIHGHRSMYDDTISTYQAGSIRDLPGFQYASLLDGLQKNYLDQVSGTVEECEAAYVGRKEAWEEEIRQRKEQAMISMIAAVGTLIIGGIVIVCTFGMATPLVVGTTAVTLSSVVSVSAGFAIGGATFLYGESNFCESYNSYQYGLKGDARTVAENPIRDTWFAGNPELYYTVGNVCTMAASMMIPVGGSMMAAVNAGTSPVRAGLTELGMLGYSSVMASETADIVTDMTDSELAGMVAGTIVGIESYGGLKTLDQSVNISGLYSVNMPDISKLDNVANSQKEMYGESNPSIVEKLTADSVKSAIERNGLTVDEFSELLQPNRVLSNSELELVQKVRNDIGLPDTGTTMSKTIPQSDLYKYLNGEYDSVRGFVSVDEYSNSLNGLNSVYEGNRLDYNNTAFKIGYGVDGISQSVGAPDTVYGKITYVLEDAESVNLCTDVPNVDNAPYTGTGFTGSKNIVLPEQVQTPRNFITGDLLGIYDSGTGAEISLYSYDLKLREWILIK